MPKVNWKKKSAGVLSRKLHPYHRHWVFKYTEKDAQDTGEAFLTNADLEECAYKRQIKIVAGSVLLYIGEQDSTVHVDLHLPCQVTMIVIHKFGCKTAFCYATVGGCKNCSVFPGNELKREPHANRC